MLKHITSPNGGVGSSGRHVIRPDSSMVMEPRIDPSTVGNHHQHNHVVTNHRYANTTSRSSANNLSGIQRLHQPQPLNISTLNSSKHSIGGGTSSSISPGTHIPPNTMPKVSNGGLNISRLTAISKPVNVTTNTTISRFHNKAKEAGVKEMLVSLGLLCLVSLLLALLSLIFLLKISPVTANDVREVLRAEQLTVITAEEYVVVYEVTLALCALTLSLNLCCLLVCAIQFLFAVKLVKSRHGGNERTNKYLQKSSISRVCAVAGFFISIPVFLTGIILYTFIQFHSTPAIVTSAFIGLGIIFCGCAMVHNVFVWQREKTNAVKQLALQHQQEQQNIASSTQIFPSHQNISITNPNVLNSSHNYHPNTHHHSYHNVMSLNQSGPYIVRPSTTTPPTPTSPGNGKLTVAVGSQHVHPREASGSVSPGMPALAPATGHDISSVGTTNSPHELSTLV